MCVYILHILTHSFHSFINVNIPLDHTPQILSDLLLAKPFVLSSVLTILEIFTDHSPPI